MAYEEMPVVCPTTAVLLEEIQNRRAAWEDSGHSVVLATAGLWQFGPLEFTDAEALAYAHDFWSTYYANCCRCRSSCHDRDPGRVIAPPCGHFHCDLHEGRGYHCSAWRCAYEGETDAEVDA